MCVEARQDMQTCHLLFDGCDYPKLHVYYFIFNARDLQQNNKLDRLSDSFQIDHTYQKNLYFQKVFSECFVTQSNKLHPHHTYLS